MKRHVLDANALLRYLMAGNGGDVVTKLIKQARNEGEKLSICVVNWGEVFYTLARLRGWKHAEFVMQNARVLPIEVVDAGQEITATAARLKVNYALPYADCFAAALAGTDGVLVTADIKDFKRVPGLRLLALPEHKSKP